jgi:hypothetical protein
MRSGVDFNVCSRDAGRVELLPYKAADLPERVHVIDSPYTRRSRDGRGHG